uniref:UNC93-like protein MFSD11 n=1 Tax=Panagrellus redivivus TaxID=6233 RepID=A0A7E4VE86_PANRE
MLRAFRRTLLRPTMGLDSNTVNVTQMSLGFLCIFFAFNSQGFIEQTVINSKHDQGVISKKAGYYSLAIIYGVFTVANFFTPPIVNTLKARWSMVLAALTYAIFQACFLFLNEACLYISSALIGVGAAVIWTAQGKYIAINSTSETATKHSSLFWGISQICLALGGVFLYIVFKDAGRDPVISNSTIFVLYGVFTAVTLVGVGLLALLRMPSNEVLLGSSESSSEEEVVLSTKEIVVSTMRLLTTRRMAFLSLAFMYTGIELSFWSGIYPTCISFTKALGDNTKRLIAFNAIAQGLGQGLAGFLFGIMSEQTKRLGRITIVLLGSTVHLITFVAVYINFPKDAPLNETDETAIIHPSVVIAVACGFFLGFGDACWNTQIFSFLVTRYNDKSTEAFSLFKFFQSLLTCAAFFYGSAIQLQWHLLILVVTGVIGCFGFIVAERMPADIDESRQLTTTHCD